jgi:hypothetical protein
MMGRALRSSQFRSVDKEAVAVVVLCTSFVLLSAFTVLGNFQDHGGDFAQYITHARNLLWHRPWSYYLRGYPAVLPAYPILLSLPTALFGVNFYVYAIINSILWAAVGFVSYLSLRRGFSSPFTAFALLVGTLFLPYVFYFQQNALPNILYAFAVVGALLAATRLANADLARRGVIWRVLVLLAPAVVRTESLALYAAIAAWFVLQRKYRLLVVPVVGVCMVVTLDLAIAISGHQESNFHVILRIFDHFAVPGSTQPSALSKAAYGVPFMLSAYLTRLGSLLFPPDLQMWPAVSLAFGPTMAVSTSIPSVVLLILALREVARLPTGKSPYALFFWAHLATLSAFLTVTSRGAPRYLLPVLPFFLSCCLLSFERVFAGLGIRPAFFGPAILATIIATSGYGCCAVRRYPAMHNKIVTPTTVELVAWCARNDNQSGIAHYKARVLTMLLDGKYHGLPCHPLVRKAALRRYLRQSGFTFVVRKFPAYEQEAILAKLRASRRAVAVFENKDYAVFRSTKPSGE